MRSPGSERCCWFAWSQGQRSRAPGLAASQVEVQAGLQHMSNATASESKTNQEATAFVPLASQDGGSEF
eukprot:1157469-Pelagomonas_calceolata.AAC.6